MKLEPGEDYRIYYNKGNINNCRIHIRAIVDDHMVVFQEYLKRRKIWVYKMKSLYYFELLDEGGNIAKIKTGFDLK